MEDLQRDHFDNVLGFFDAAQRNELEPAVAFITWS